MTGAALPVVEQVAPTSFKQGDARWAAYRARALRDLYWFNAVVLGYADRVPMRPSVHLLLCRFVEKRTGNALLDTARYRKIEMPRETGKSTLIPQGYAIQRICQNPNIGILIVNEKELLAKDFLSGIKWHFENNNLFRALFPELIPADLNDTTWSATRIIVNRTTGRPDPTVDVIGVGGTVTGKHPDLILCDDIISREAMENARAGSWQIIHQTNRWINQLDPIVNKGAEPFPEIIFIGTRWWHKDSYEHIEECFGNGEDPRPVLLRATLPDGTTQQLSAYRTGDIAVFRRAAIEDGRSIFPEKWDLEHLAKLRMRDPALFACNYMNQPSDDVTATFKAGWLKTFTWLDEDKLLFLDESATRRIVQLRDLDIVLILDPGGFKKHGTTDDRSRPTIVVLGDDLAGHYFFLDCSCEQGTYLMAIRETVAFAQKYRPRKVYTERAGQQAAFAQLLRAELAKAECEIPVDSDTLTPGNQVLERRVLEIEPYFQRGQVYVGTGKAFHEFRTQYEQFPRAKRFDVLVCLGYWPRVMRNRGASSQQTTAQRRAQELATYRAKRRWRP